MHYLDSGEHVGSETRHRVLISADGRWRIFLDQSNGQAWLNWSLDDRALKPSFLVCLSLLHAHIRIAIGYAWLDHGNDSIIELHAVYDTTPGPPLVLWTADIQTGLQFMISNCFFACAL